MQLKRMDAGVLVFLLCVAIVATLIFKLIFFASILLFFGFPALYLALRDPGIFKKSALFALIFTIPVWLFADTLAAVNGAWIIPTSIMPYRLFGMLTFENFVFCLLWVLYAILFYEHFFGSGRRSQAFSPAMKYFVSIFGAGALVVLTSLYVNENLLRIPYVYFWGSVVLWFIPLVSFLYFYPRFLQKYVFQGICFFFILFSFELVALKLGLWSFPARDFVGSVSIFNQTFPLEEFVGWMMLATPSLLAYYEFFANDRKL